MSQTMHDDHAARRVATGLLAGWLRATTTRWAARLTVWGLWLAAIAAYAGYVWWRVRRMLRAEERGAGAYGLEVRSSSDSQQSPRTPAPQ